MNDTRIQKRPSGTVKEKGQYLLAFGVVGSMLLVAGMPSFVIFFFAIFAYFIFRIFASGSRNETRDIFEFYLTANEILRDDGRNWFGFEIRDAVAKGEAIVTRMNGAPPLLQFALGALYNKAGDHQSAINSLTQVVESETGRESSYVYATPELRNYVRVLRKIERDPSEAPLTSASIRALERARRLRAKILLDESRTAYVQSASRAVPKTELSEHNRGSVVDLETNDKQAEKYTAAERFDHPSITSDHRGNGARSRSDASKKEKKDPFSDRKPITEVLHDIYDKNVQ